ncbi:hypothetical protein SAMN05444392_10764 [Seinonella peptonophila]|uniref:Uncharacterized protein n=1 Tax=Seinonella peptonophila TaxID=112248 RepID=A0A1M4YP76_9BACL|nr:hypothetical protein [Seinonella peptonophila]SHF07463.1 hypothetical protein SAMN05444392_10764 [Seinonella peptonophila]
MVGKIVYFAATGTSIVCKGRVLRMVENECNMVQYFIQNIDQIGTVILTQEEIYFSEEEAQKNVLDKVRRQYIKIVESLSPKELLQYLVSLHPIRNEIDQDVKKTIERSIENYFDIVLDD